MTAVPALMQLPIETSPEERRLYIMLRLQEHLLRPLALLQGYLSMLEDGTLTDVEQVLPLVLGTTQDLYDRIREVVTYAPIVWFPQDMQQLVQEVARDDIGTAHGLRDVDQAATRGRATRLGGRRALRERVGRDPESV